MKDIPVVLEQPWGRGGTITSRGIPWRQLFVAYLSSSMVIGLTMICCWLAVIIWIGKSPRFYSELLLAVNSSLKCLRSTWPISLCSVVHELFLANIPWMKLLDNLQEKNLWKTRCSCHLLFTIVFVIFETRIPPDPWGFGVVQFLSWASRSLSLVSTTIGNSHSILSIFSLKNPLNFFTPSMKFFHK